MIYASEKHTYPDPLTGIPVTQLTRYKGHSHHFYFTNPGWYDGGARFLFSSDRGNRTNLFGVDLASGEIEQFTDLAAPGSGRFDFITACKHALRDTVYFWRGHTLHSVDLSTRELRELLTVETSWKPSIIASACDGSALYFSLESVVLDEDYSNSARNNLGIRERWLARPRSRILRLPIAPDGRTAASADVIFEEKALLGHVNASPTQPHLITYCHEGPWEEVDCRIWVMDARTGRRWKIEPPQRRFHIGHEFWYADGLHVGYHGITGGPETVIGGASVAKGAPNHWFAPQQTVTGHVHSLDAGLVVGDAYHDGVIKVWRRIEGKMHGPRVLCRHDCSFKIQQLHVHPRLSPDGRYVIYTSDRGGYGNLYTAPLPQDDASFLALPAWGA